MREEGSSIGGLNATIRNAGKPTKDGFFGTESALFRMLAASKGGNFKRSPWHDAASYLCSFGLHALIWYLLIKAWSQILGVDEEVLPSMETNTKLSDLKGVDELKTELEEIVHYLKDPEVRKEEDVDVMIIAQYTSGLSRDDLAKLVDVAALRAAEYGAKAVSMHDLEFARDTIKLGIVK